ncbi:MAG TPA: HAMP domain-containing histidine kinase, partial [Planctomycetes bacterium]|nr:HAMP domain-containing histidine kinase [Planctomycetota bacterium]
CLGQVVWWVFFALGETRRTAQEKREILRGRCYQALVLLHHASQHRVSQNRASQRRASQHRTSQGRNIPEIWEKRLAPRFPELELLPRDPAAAGTSSATSLPSPQVLGSELVPEDSPLARFQLRPKPSALAAILEETRRRRRMFYWEGGSLTALVIMGVLLLYRTLRNDIEIRKGHQRFLAGATHELKTPLSSLRLALETLKTGTVSPDRSEAFYDNMLLEVERLQNQIENLLKTASIQKRPDRNQRVDLARLLEEVVAEQRPRLAEKALDVGCEILARNTWVQGDEAALRQLLVNLIDNARLYSPKGGKVRLKLEERRGQLVFQISNSGPGIPEEDRERVFERFFRGKDTKETGGSGLGLYLARQVARDHGGKLLLLPGAERSEEERCTTFALELPQMRNEP